MKKYKIVFRDTDRNKAVKGNYVEKDGFLTVNTIEGIEVIINKKDVVFMKELIE